MTWEETGTLILAKGSMEADSVAQVAPGRMWKVFDHTSLSSLPLVFLCPNNQNSCAISSQVVARPKKAELHASWHPLSLVYAGSPCSQFPSKAVCSLEPVQTSSPRHPSCTGSQRTLFL